MEKYYLVLLIFFVSAHAAEKVENNLWSKGNYSNDPSDQSLFGEYMISRIIFQENETVIDIGCGNGLTTKEIAKKVPKGLVAGVDNDPKMLEQARIHCKGIKNIGFHCVDATTMEVEKKVDKIIATCSLSWIPNQKAVYECISEMLISGGKFFALISDANNPLFISYNKVLHSPKWQRFALEYTPIFCPSTKEQIEEYFINTSLKLVCLEKVKFARTKMSRKNFFNNLYANQGFKEFIPRDRYGEFLNDVVKEYITQTNPIDENNLEVSCDLFFVEGQNY